MTEILLIDPKYPHNVGQALRMASCFDVSRLLIWGDRVPLEGNKAAGYRLPREERLRDYQKVALVKTDKPFDLARDLVPVCVELSPSAECLPFFEHPEDALYVFGPEDGHVPKVARMHCQRFVQIPMQHCANLATAVAMTLYDRHAKDVRAGAAPLALLPT